MTENMRPEEITENTQRLLSELPEGVRLVAAAKTRTAEEVAAVIRGGVRLIGYNYVQEAEAMQTAVTEKVGWHMIGHLQRNKVKKALQIFDLIETVDSLRLARAIDKQNAGQSKKIPVLIEVNSGREDSKSGVLPEEVPGLIGEISNLTHLSVQGLMTMGPFVDEAELLRPCFRLTHDLFRDIRRENIPSVEMKYLSMGMSESYRTAIEEGANIVRIGTLLFGPRR